MIDSVSKMLGIGTFSMRALSRSISRKNCGLEAEKVVKTPVQAGRLVGLAGDLVGKRQDWPHVGAVALLQHHLEAAGIADAAHRRRRQGDDEGLLDALQAAEQSADDLAGGLAALRADARNLSNGAKITPRIAGVGEGRAGEAGEGHRIGDAGRLADDLDGPLDHRVGAASDAPSGNCTTTIA